MDKPYWMVMGNGRPTFKHESELSAIVEAKRLANQYKGSEFLVIKIVGCACVEDTCYKSYECGEPF